MTVKILNYVVDIEESVIKVQQLLHRPECNVKTFTRSKTYYYALEI